MARVRRRLVLALVTAVAASALAAGAVARTPLPASPQGTGKEPTAGGGVVAGTPFRARSAFAFQDGFGDINIFLLPRASTCHTVSEQDVPYIWVYVLTAGRRLPVAKPVKPGTGERLLANFTTKTGRYTVGDRVSLTLTRIDPGKNGVWHGTLKVPARTVSGQRVSYDGTFAARWCGQR
jgi:hypothetical protein